MIPNSCGLWCPAGEWRRILQSLPLFPTGVSRQASSSGYEIDCCGAFARVHGASAGAGRAFRFRGVRGGRRSRVWKWFAPRTATGSCFRNVPDGPKFCFPWRAKYCAGRRRRTRAREAEITNLSQRRFGILGKSLLEARPGMVNALTSLLGNADLILLSEEPLPDHCRENVRTIHTMALRLNEIVQRLSSIENEMELSERKSHLETPEMRMAESSKT